MAKLINPELNPDMQVKLVTAGFVDENGNNINLAALQL